MFTTWTSFGVQPGIFFLQMLDRKFVRSRGVDAWLLLARRHEWIKE
jgi:hypothetical protein